jgi:hypothetical protein
MRWRARPGEIAARIESHNMPAQNKQLIVEENTLALLMENGLLVGERGPGLYKIQSFEEQWIRRRPEVAVILLDSGEVPVEFSLADLWTIDPLRLNATCRLVLRIVDAKRFIANVLKGRPLFSVTDLRQLLYPELYAAAQTYVGDHSMDQLEAERSQRREDFAVDVQERLRDFFSQTGLAFQRVQMFDLRHPRIDAMRAREEELFLGPADFDLEQRRSEQDYARKQVELQGLGRTHDLELNAQRQELTHRQRLFDLMSEEELHKIAQEEASAAQFEQRAQLWDRMRRAVQQDQLNEATTQEEWAKFVAELDKRKLLREDELENFRDSLRWGSEDRHKERAHSLALAELYSQYERKAAELSEQHKFDQAQLQGELALQRAKILGGLELRQAEVAAQLRLDEAERQEAARVAEHERVQLAKAQEAHRAQDRIQQDHTLGLDSDRQAHDRTQRKEDVAADLGIRQDTATVDSTIALQNAKTADEIARLQRTREAEEDKADLARAADAMALLKENKANRLRIEREDEEEKRRIAREDELRRQEAAIAAEKERHAMDLAKTAQSQQHELSTLKMRSEMSIEALISLSGLQQAQILGELKRMEHFKGMSEQQIMILAAERSPDVAKALLAKTQAAEEGKLQAAEAAKWQALADERSKHEAALRQQLEAHQAAQMKTIEAASARETQAARDAAERAERMAKEAADRQERSNSEALRIVGDVAKTYAQNQPAAPTVILSTNGTGSPAAPTVVGGIPGVPATGAPGALGEVQVCPNCRVKMPVGEKFCANCGHRFFD